MMDDARQDTLGKLAKSRADIRRLLDPPLPETAAAAGEDTAEGNDTFPRSRTMRMLMTGRGLTTAGAVVAGLLVARPALLGRALKLIPTGAVARMLLVKGLAWVKTRR
jgi:hypothetical protein